MPRVTGRPPSGTPPRSPFLPPAPRAQLPPADPQVRQRAGAALVLSVLSLLAMMLIGNIQRGATVAAVALVVAVAGLVLAVSALSAAKRARSRRPRSAVFGVVLGVIGVLFSGSALVGLLAFGTQISQYASCMNAAGTATEQQVCQNQLDNSIGHRVGLPGR
ncbi:MAG TPA: hypothetical protein VHF26_07370 [Trebonia sp.]|nr:hypothetical protein [Trebonia sp.]